MILEEPAEATNTTAHAEQLSAASSCEKKPSYLSLACCVSGYSNLTHYDSKLRQEINKSREVSPIRPSTADSIQHCKKRDALVAPVLDKMPDEVTPTKQNGAAQNGSSGSNGGTPQSAQNLSFIQQRVERLYGPSALAQGFYSPRKNASPHLLKTQRRLEATPANRPECCELQAKFKELSPGRDYGDFKRKLDTNVAATRTTTTTSVEVHLENVDADLPVFRHLTQEFRAQLPLVSPKRYSRSGVTPPGSAEKQAVNGNDRHTHTANTSVVAVDVVDKAAIVIEPEVSITAAELLPTVDIAANKLNESSNSSIKDGNYFLLLLAEENRHLLLLAAEADKYIEALANNPDVSEDTMGFLRSAAGKARLLVSQKMKQFEGLCYQNLNCSPEDKFPTTLDDLQGFWDMVQLQVLHVHSIFEELDKLKSNNWQSLSNETEREQQAPKTQKPTNPKTAAVRSSKPTNGNNGAKTNGAASAAALKREAQRKQIMEMKRLHREKMINANAKTDDNSVIDAKPAAVASTEANNVHGGGDGVGDVEEGKGEAKQSS